MSMIKTGTRTDIRADLARYGSWSAVALIVLTIVWIVSLGLAPAPEADATATDRLAFVGENDGWQIINFAVVLPLGLVHVPVWLGLAALAWSVRPVASALIVAFGLLYAPFTVTGYWLQLTTVRGLVDLAERDPERAAAAFEIIGFTGDHWSASYGVVVLGYAVWSIAALAVFAGLRDFPYRLARVTSVLFAGAGTLGILGAIGFVARNALLELGVLFSGILFVPALVGTAVLLYQYSTDTSRAET